MAIPRNLLWQNQGFLLDRIHAIILQMTMGLNCSEVAGLQYRDLTDGSTDISASESWVMPEGPDWFLRIRRVSKRVPSENGAATKCILAVPTDIYEIRLLAVPTQAKIVLKEYLDLYAQGVVGNTPLIRAKRTGGGVTLDALRHFSKDVLKVCGGGLLYRAIRLPASNILQDDRYEMLKPNLTIFQTTLEEVLLRCGCEQYEARYYLGRSPVSVLDEHYWESKSRPGQLRMRCKMDRWNLRGNAHPEDLRAHHEWHKAEGQAVSQAPVGLMLQTMVNIAGAPGNTLYADLKIPYGFTCRYVVTHSEPLPAP